MRVSRFTRLFQDFLFRTSSKHSRREVETIKSTRSVIPTVSATVAHYSWVRFKHWKAELFTYTTWLLTHHKSKWEKTPPTQEYCYIILRSSGFPYKGVYLLKVELYYVHREYYKLLYILAHWFILMHGTNSLFFHGRDLVLILQNKPCNKYVKGIAEEYWRG